MTFVVNRAQAYKWTNNEEKCRQVLDGEDWTATSLKFKLANAVLHDDFKEVNGIVKLIGKDDIEVNKHAYREWPLFKELRKTPEFPALFEQIFGESLNKVFVQDTEVGTPLPQHLN